MSWHPRYPHCGRCNHLFVHVGAHWVRTDYGANMRNEAERIFRGGTILTMDDARPRVEAVAIADGRILAAGAESEVMATRGDATESSSWAARP